MKTNTHILPKIIDHSFFQKAILILIVSSIALMIIDSLPEISSEDRQFLTDIDEYILILFSIEIILRFIAHFQTHPSQSTVQKMVSFFKSPLNIIDILVVLPFYLPSFIALDITTLRIFRLLRITALLFKTSRYSKSLQTLGRVFILKGSDLLVTVILVAVLLLLASTLMYHVEGEVQPEVFSSIPATMWWAVATLTTVGYGDVYPVSAAGKLIASFISILGIGLFALPAGILGAGFLEIRQQEDKEKRCPHCGKKPD